MAYRIIGTPLKQNIRIKKHFVETITIEMKEYKSYLETNEIVEKVINKAFSKYNKTNTTVKFQLVYKLNIYNDGEEYDVWRAGKFFSNRSNTIEYPEIETQSGESDIQDGIRINTFNINRVIITNDKGGKSLNNDCLYIALKHCLGQNLTISPIALKLKLGYKRVDEICCKDIPQIEKLTGCNIDLVGDYEYISNKSNPFYCKIELVDNHYKYLPNKTVYNQLYTQPTTKKLITYNQDGNHYNVFDGVGIKKVTSLEEKAIYIQNDDIEKHYNSLMKDHNDLSDFNSKITNYKFNLQGCKFNLTTQALNFFYTTCKTLQLENISSLEQSFLHKTKCSGLQFAEYGWAGNVKTFDINSFYPFIMKSKKYGLPYTKPIEMTLTTKQLNDMEFIPYGLYNVKIHTPTPCKYLSPNKNNFYTHFDLNIARQEGYKIEILNENVINCIMYKQRLSNHKIFTEYINTCYEMKTKLKSKTSKVLLNCLWGKLCQKNYQYHKLNSSNVLELESFNDVYIENSSCKYIKDDIYKLPYGRWGVFITAMGRYMMYKYMKPIEHSVKRIHTDSFMVDIDTCDLSKINISEELGDFKEEINNTVCICKSGLVKIVNQNKVIQL